MQNKQELLRTCDEQQWTYMTDRRTHCQKWLNLWGLNRLLWHISDMIWYDAGWQRTLPTNPPTLPPCTHSLWRSSSDLGMAMWERSLNVSWACEAQARARKARKARARKGRSYHLLLMIYWRFHGHITSYLRIWSNWKIDLSVIFGPKMTKSGMPNTGGSRRSSNFTFDMITFRIGPFRNFFKKFWFSQNLRIIQ